MTIENTIKILIANGSAELVSSELQEHPEVDILYDEGEFFKIAVAHSKINVLQVLFDVFDKKLPLCTSDESLYAKVRISNILHDAVDSSFPSEDTVVLLKPYMYDNDGNDSREENDADVSISETYIAYDSRSTSNDHLTVEELANVATGALDHQRWLSGVTTDALGASDIL